VEKSCLNEKRQIPWEKDEFRGKISVARFHGKNPNSGDRLEIPRSTEH